METQQATFYATYESPVFSQENLRLFLASTISHLEKELQTAQDWKIEDPDELHHIHIKNANLHRIKSELTIAKQLFCIAPDLKYSKMDEPALESEYRKYASKA
ncbi:MAG: hypothetical protein RL204_664 [Bacteroidota bacterium]|jgi:hypothetical protein